MPKTQRGDIVPFPAATTATTAIKPHDTDPRTATTPERDMETGEMWR
jgi:hypothetical protein